MRTMSGQVVLNVPAERAWEMYRNNEIISKIDPSMLAGAQYLQGDGSPGSFRLFTLGPVVQGYVKESMEEIEEVEWGKSVTYKVVAGELRDMYDPYRVTFSFFPVTGAESKQCIAEWKAEYQVKSPATPMPKKAKDFALEFLKSFDKFELCN